MRAADLRKSIMEALDGRVTTSELNVMLVVAFIESQLKLVDDRWAGQPAIVEDYLLELFLRPLFGTLDRYGRRKYTEALLGLPRKHAKTTTIAELGLYFLTMEPVPGQEIITIAKDEVQARKGITMANAMIRQNPLLFELVGGKTFRDVIHIPEIGASWRCFPHNASDLQGEHPRIAICEEPHTYKSAAAIDALRSGMGGREEPLLIGVTTAGPSRHGPLWEWIEQIKKDPRGLYVWHGARDDEPLDDQKVWRKYNVAPWITMDYLKDEFRRLSRNDFERYHLNRFPMQDNALRAVTWEEWAKCKKPPKLDESAPCVVAVDGAQSGDSFAIVVDQLDATGVHHWLAYILDEPPEETGYYPLDEIEELLATIWRTLNVTRMAMDPSRLLLLMQRLQNVHGIPVEEFPQSNVRMCPASSMWREVIRDGKVRAGRGKAIERHVLDAIELPREPRGWRIGRASKAERIDGAVASAMAVYLAEAETGSEVWAGSW